MAQTFYSWLKKQKHRDDPVGDLANDATKDPSFPRTAKTHYRYREYLLKQNASAKVFTALLEAFCEYDENFADYVESLRVDVYELAKSTGIQKET